MTQELTTADGFTLKTATKEDHDYDYTSDLDVTLDRWSKSGHDRLYVNGLNWDCYVDLSDATVHVDGGAKLTPVGTELDGDELTITVVYGRKNFPDKTVTFVVTVHGEEFNAEEETHECDECDREFDTERGVAIHKGHKHTDDSNSGENADSEATTSNEDSRLLADGGRPTFTQFRDSDIQAAIKKHASETDESSLTLWTGEVAEALADLQTSLETCWSEHLDAIDDDHMSVVFEDSEVLVLADHSGHGWNEELSAMEARDTARGAMVKSTHYKAAEHLCDYSWVASDPFVMAKPEGWRLGETHLERRVGQIASTADVSEAAAMDYWSVEIKGRSQSEWARMVGKSQQAVSENIAKAREGFDSPELS